MYQCTNELIGNCWWCSCSCAHLVTIKELILWLWPLSAINSQKGMSTSVNEPLLFHLQHLTRHHRKKMFSLVEYLNFRWHLETNIDMGKSFWQERVYLIKLACYDDLYLINNSDYSKHIGLSGQIGILNFSDEQIW